MGRGPAVRVLGAADLATAQAVIDRDPVANVFVASRVAVSGLHPRSLGAEMWAFGAGEHVDALCYAGANMVPVEADDRAADAFAERAQRLGRHCSSIVGPVDAVERMWCTLESSWGPARAVRSPQPLLTLRPNQLRLAGNEHVRRVRPDELDILMPACVAMFTEEIGISPTAGDGGALYRARVAELIAEGRAFAHIEDERVLFKAEIGAATPRACQMQGVWVDPALRGEGRGTAGTAAVAGIALREVAPVVSLYVNEFNTAALTAYREVGFQEAGAFASVLF